MDDGTVKAVITYEDDAGNQTREELNVNIMVSDMPMDAGMEMEPMLPEEPEDEGMGAGMIAAIAVGVIAAAGIAAALILKLRKKKKAAKLLAEDLMDLDQKDR